MIGGADGIDGHDVEAVNAAINEALAQDTAEAKPTLIVCRTIIGRGSPHRGGTAKAHGEALGDDEVAATRAEIGWTEPPFTIPKDVYAAWDAKPAGAKLEKAWNDRFAAYRKAHPEAAAELLRRLAGDRPPTWPAVVDKLLAECAQKKESLGTRKASAAAIAAFVNELPEMFGGSADLTPSNNTDWKGMQTVRVAADGGRYIHYGVREFGMAAIMNGINTARRLPRLRRHVPDVLRLHAQRDPHGGDHEAADGLRVHARLDRSRRGRPDAPGRRACVVACG